MSGETLRPQDAPASIYGPDGRPVFFADPAMDRFAAVLLNLVSEVWVQTERLDTIQAALDRKGVLSKADVAAILADPTHGDAAGAAAQAYARRVMAPLREGA